MTDSKDVRISKVVKEFNIGISTLVDFLKKKGIDVEANPNTKISADVYKMAAKEFGKEQDIKEASKKVNIKPIQKIQNELSTSDEGQEQDEESDDDVQEVIIKTNTVEVKEPKVVGKMNLDELEPKPKAPAQPEKVEPIVTPEEKEDITNSVESTTTTTTVDKQPETPEVVAEDIPKKQDEEPIVEKETVISAKDSIEAVETPKILGKIDLTDNKGKKKELIRRVATSTEVNSTTEVKATPDQKTVENSANITAEPKKEDEFIPTKFERLSGPNVVGKIDLQQFAPKRNDDNSDEKKKRKRIKKDKKVNVSAGGQQPNTGPQSGGGNTNTSAEPKRPITRPILNKDRAANTNTAGNSGGGNKRPIRGRTNEPRQINQPVDDEAVQRQIKDTLARLTAGKSKAKSAKYRRDKRDAVNQRNIQEMERQEMESTTLELSEFVTVNELASMMDAPVIQVIEACMNLGLMVSINQRLDAEALVLVAEEFGFKVDFVSVDLQDAVKPEEDAEEDLVPRPPIVTVMGHVDHGKTSLLDHVRKANVIAGEAGGITQHIGAYNVQLSNGRHITFLDTPGHEAFTAMRARGAKVTDLAIIIIAADDAVMPQTTEAINHAVAAGVPMIFAINKVDKPGANSEKIREQLAAMNFLVEDWGGKYQCQEISAKQGLNIDKLLDKVLLESDMLDLKANPNKRSNGTVIESSLDKGRGYVTTVLVQGGTLRVGDILISGTHTGRVKAMSNERGQAIKEAGPSMPVLVLGLNGAPTAGETFQVMEDEKEARDIANKREQLIREQGLRTKKHITLDEIGRRIAIGNFKELNVVVKADVDGSIEALADSLIKLSNEEIQVNVIHKAVGAISETDVLLAAASNAIIIGFQVRPSSSARKLAEKEEIEIRMYSVIYDAINEVRDGIEGMLAPEMKEEINATVEVIETFKITKVGTVAGCMVREGKITRNAKIRIIRDGIVVFTGSLGSLKRFKDDVREVNSGYDCGLNIENYNDIKIGDMIESYEMVEVKRKL